MRKREAGLADIQTRFNLVQQLGEGADGVVFLASDSKNNRRAVKVLRCPDGNLTSLEFDLQSAAKHPNILRLYEFVHTPWFCAAVMEEAEETLHSWLRRQHEPPAGHAVKAIMSQVVRGFAHIHSLNILHRDVHMANMMLVADSTQEQGFRCVLVDFSRAIQVAGEPAMLAVVGCVDTRAPELLFCHGSHYNDEGKHVRPYLCRYGAAADMWSFASVFLQLATGRPPFGKVSSELGHAESVINLLGVPCCQEFGWSKVAVSKCKVPLVRGSFAWGSLVADAKAKCIIKQLLVYAPARRLSAREVESYLP